MNVLFTFTFPTWGFTDQNTTQFEPSLTTIFLTFPLSLTEGSSAQALKAQSQDQCLIDAIETHPKPRQSSDKIDGKQPIDRLEINQQTEDDCLALRDTIQSGLKVNPPQLIDEGVGGTYLLKNLEGEPFGIFKPVDEEPGQKNNPKPPLEKPKYGVLPGEGAVREVAAYLLDHDHFAGVPPTLLTTLSHPGFRASKPNSGKFGSLQKFISNSGASWDMGPGKFDQSSVHRIAQLDIRLFNMDRNGGNLLLRKETNGLYTLIPIDHTYTLPDALDGAFFEWQYWPQAKMPLDDSMKDYILNKIDIQKDAQILRELQIREECIKTMKISTILLKEAVKAGLTLFQIAGIMVKKPGKKMSELQEALTKNGNPDDEIRIESVLKELVQQRRN